MTARDGYDAPNRMLPSRTITTFLIALLCLIWGSTWIVIRWGLADLPPFGSAGVRFLIAAILMSIVARVARGREGGSAPPWWLSLALGSLNFGASYACVYWSETRLPSGLASILWSIFPMSMALSGHVFLPGERLHAKQWLGFVAGFAGVVLLFANDLRAIGPEAVPAGLVLCLSPLAATIGTTLAKRHGQRVSSLLLNRNGMWIGALLLCALALLLERGTPAHWTPRAIAGVAYLAAFGTVLAFGLYFWLLRHVDAYRMSLISYITPAIALFLGWLFGGERITLTIVCGSALILFGIVLVVRGRIQPSKKP